MANILIIDDEAPVCRLLGRIVERMGHAAASRRNLKEGLREAKASAYDVVLLDVHLPDGSGLDAISPIHASHSLPEVIIMTGYGDPDGAELAIRNGAWDYIQKPVTEAKIELPIRRALQFRDRQAGARRSVSLRRGGIVGRSAPMQSCFDQMAQAAGGDSNVLVLGETGTGKELFARALHRNSPRSQGPFVVVDCTVLPDHLVESELFGHEKGAFTGASRDRSGLVAKADGGTLFLDEIGELPPAAQKAFLRVLQERRFRMVGGRREIRSDFRLVAATNRDLDGMARRARFRQDLLFRLRGMTITLPPLRERGDDIREIALYHMSRLCEGHRVPTKGFSGEFLDALEGYDWPGNVRELNNALESAFWAAGDQDTLSFFHLPVPVRARIARASVDAADGSRREPPDPGPLPAPETPPSFRARMDAAEKRYFQALLSATGGDMDACQAVSGLSRSRIYALLKKHALSRSRT